MTTHFAEEIVFVRVVHGHTADFFLERLAGTVHRNRNVWRSPGTAGTGTLRIVRMSELHSYVVHMQTQCRRRNLRNNGVRTGTDVRSVGLDHDSTVGLDPNAG